MVALLLKYWQYVLILILAVALVLSVRSCKNQKELVTLEKNSHDSTFHQAEQVKLKTGEQAFRIQTLEATVHELQGQDIVSEVDKIRLREQIGNLNHLVAFWKGSVRATDTITAILHDTIYIDGRGAKVDSKYLKWASKYLSIDGLIHGDSVKIDYSYKVDFSLTAYRKGQNLFNRGQLVTDVVFSDPNMKVNRFEGMVIREPPPKRFSVGPTIGYFPFVPGPQINKIQFGFSVTYGVVKF